jgi:hypothetical protein
MSIPKRATVYFEPEVYQALRLRALAAHRSMSEIVNEAVRTALKQAVAERSAVDRSKKGSSASFDRLVEALKRRRLVRHRSRPPRS